MIDNAWAEYSRSVPHITNMEIIRNMEIDLRMCVRLVGPVWCCWVPWCICWNEMASASRVLSKHFWFMYVQPFPHTEEQGTPTVQPSNTASKVANRAAMADPMSEAAMTCKGRPHAGRRNNNIAVIIILIIVVLLSLPLSLLSSLSLIWSLYLFTVMVAADAK